MSIHRLFSLLILLRVMITCPAQNLVPNAGFEYQLACPEPGQIELSPPWNTPISVGSSDNYDMDCPVSATTAFSGTCYAGIFLYVTHPTSTYREYLQAPLLEHLKENTQYCVSLWVKRVETIWKFATDDIGILFTNMPIYQEGFGYIDFDPQIQHPSDSILYANEWEQVTGSFIADGSEANIVIGNFKSNEETTLISVMNTIYTGAYYFIDEISVMECEDFNVSIAEVGVHYNSALNAISVMSKHRIHQIDLYDPLGRLMETRIFDRTLGRVDLSVDQKIKGIVLLRILTDTGEVSKKVLITDH